jgi:MoxR-like ATPase
MQSVHRSLADCIRLLRKENILLSDRRIVKSQRLIAAAAVMDGRVSPDDSDLWPLLHVIANEQDQATARDILKEKFATSSNNTLSAAAENASMGPLARAQRLTQQITLLLEKPEAERDALVLEALGREIDASFSLDSMPAPLKMAREQLLLSYSETE